jgi:hypothetical protein
MSPARRVLAVVVGACAAAPAAGCETDPVEHICPDVDTGGFVVTEIRGDQDPDDDLGQWVELYNASGAEQDLIGLHLRLRSLGGTTDDVVIVRRSVVVAAGGYAVIGLGSDADGVRPDAIDYGAGGDAGSVMPPSGAVDVDGCAGGTEQLLYDNGLPAAGTYSLGLSPPSATGNDAESAWCTNPTSAGTPGAANPPCP